jgi:hypothetical protein
VNPSFSASPVQPSSIVPGSPRKGGSPAQVTVRGSVVAGVEAGCMLLKADDGQSYLLLGGDRTALASGGRMEVVGRLAVGVASYCQQGTPLQVSSVRKL